MSMASGVVTRVIGWSAVVVLVPVVLLAMALRDPGRADFVLGNGNEPKSLDPAEASAIPEGRVARFLFEPLVTLDNATLEPLPGAAVSWTSDPTGLRWTFTLRDDGRFADGTRVEAAHFVDAFRRLVDPKTASRAAAYLLDVANARAVRSGKRPPDALGVAATSPTTFVMTLETRPADFIRSLAFPALVPLKIVESADGRASGRRIIGNGPFRVDYRRPRDRIRLERNPHHRDAAKTPRTVDVLACDSAGTLLNMFLAGDVDWVTDVPPSLVAPLRARADGALRTAPMSGTYFLRVNTRKPHLADIRVRRALDLAVDREALVRAALPGGESAANGLVAPGSGWNPRPPRGDPAEARRLLDAFLAEKGLRELPPVEYAYNTLDIHQTIAEVLQRGWTETLGIRVRLARMENASLLAAVKAGDFDLARGSWIADHTDPTTFLDVFRSDAPNNQTGFADPTFDARLAAGAALPEGPARLTALFDAESVLLDASAVIPIHHYASYNLVARNVRGFGLNALDIHFPQQFETETLR